MADEDTTKNPGAAMIDAHPRDAVIKLAGDEMWQNMQRVRLAHGLTRIEFLSMISQMIDHEAKIMWLQERGQLPPDRK